MTAGASKHGVVSRVGMARRTNSIRTVMILREPCVIEGCTCPRRSRVTRCACRRESGCNVIGIRCTVVISLMTGIAVGRRPYIDIVDVAQITRHRHMRARQRKWRIVVIECRWAPCRCRMTYITSCRNS